jgi:hypothetical protein
MVRTALSRAESVRRYFLTLPASDRADVLTVRDAHVAELLREMQDAQAAGGAASACLFSVDGLAQRRTLKSYGQWVGARGGKAARAHLTKPADLRAVRCPPGLIVSQRIVDASVRLETELRLDLNSTLSVPVRPYPQCSSSCLEAAAICTSSTTRPRLPPAL